MINEPLPIILSTQKLNNVIVKKRKFEKISKSRVDCELVEI